MKHSIKSVIHGGVALFALSMSLISCNGALEDILGAQDNPTNVAVTSITLNETTLNKNRGDSKVTLTATVKPDNAADKTVTWSSDNPAVASVNNGEVTVLAVGTATITATANDGSGVKATCTVNVSAHGLLTGDFSVAADKKVRFAQGNLQAVFASAGSSCTWQFATNQWDYIGDAAANTSVGAGSVSTAGTVDLFGWVGESGNISSGLAIYGITNSVTQADYGANPNTDNLKSDWGTLLITNGGDAPNYGWHTLPKDEWEWLIGPISSPTPGTNCRTSSKIGNVENARWVKAVVHSTKGLIIFPDEISWDVSTMGTAPTTINTQSDDFTYTITDDAQWTALETAGCVFLPLTGERLGTSVTTGNGRYWSSNRSSWNYSWALHIDATEVNTGGQRDRFYGYSVRLVQDVY